MALLYPPTRRGEYSGVRGVCGDTSATSAGSDFKLNPVHIGQLLPPLERLERREEPEAQGGEFVEAYVAKRTKQISHEEKPLLEEFCQW
ncbi:MAG: hypothetical protein CL920_19905 [Deltaproteobacteria bacterium]|nr:hypothetical protein [Deltaproteobacteria bacterium]